jgi:hypothetical protein
MLASMNASPAALALLMACLGPLIACRGRDAPRDEPLPAASALIAGAATAKLGAASSTGKEGTNVDYTFGIEEFATESYTFEHRGLVVSVHLHALFSTPALIPRYRDADPIFAWIYVRKPGQKELVYKLNAQLDAMMAKPFFLNHDEGWGGSSVPGSGRASLWTRDELDAAIKAFLDDPKPR